MPARVIKEARKFTAWDKETRKNTDSNAIRYVGVKEVDRTDGSGSFQTVVVQLATGERVEAFLNEATGLFKCSDCGAVSRSQGLPEYCQRCGKKGTVSAFVRGGSDEEPIASK